MDSLYNFIPLKILAYGIIAFSEKSVAHYPLLQEPFRARLRVALAGLEMPQQFTLQYSQQGRGMRGVIPRETPREIFCHKCEVRSPVNAESKDFSIAELFL